MTYDDSQQKIIGLYGIDALVLAGPGCGKTRLLVRRIIHAAEHHHIDFPQMLCLTFTNRASREMSSRVASALGMVPAGLFVGNIHRFCSRFLYANNIISPDTSILDEEDVASFFSEELNINTAAQRYEVTSHGVYLYEKAHDFPSFITRREFQSPTLFISETAEKYRRFKEDNNAVDFDDLLLLTVNACLQHDFKDYLYSDYPWIQVDEVQDLTPIQLFIIESLKSHGNCTTVYLGDEQQAIFEFLGAGGAALMRLHKKCARNIYHLSRNYRSTPDLLSLCNAYARDCLGLDESLLPVSAVEKADLGEAPLRLYRSHRNIHDSLVAALAIDLISRHPSESTAILTRTNQEANSLSAFLASHGVDHLLISNKDLFTSTSFKTVFAHLWLLRNPWQTVEWSRVLYQTRCLPTLKESRRFMRLLRSVHATPLDLTGAPEESELSRFTAAGDAQECVVLDTETTGLDTLNDDVIQICALRFSPGYPDRETRTLNLFLPTDRTIPATLGNGIVNPMLRVHAAADKTNPGEALAMLADFIGDCPVIGHNVRFDMDILRHYSRRKAPDFEMKFLDRPAIDTLRITRLLYPDLRHFNLENLLKVFSIEGKNSHDAFDDVMATANLFEYLLKPAKKELETHLSVLHRGDIAKIKLRFLKNYWPHYLESRRLYLADELNSACPLAEEFLRVHKLFTEHNFIKPLRRLEEVAQLFYKILTEGKDEPESLHRQLDDRLYDLRTYKEADLVAQGITSDRITVSTIHKAKGLEMDNVIVYNASNTFGAEEEMLRVFYVAFTRAKKRLYVLLKGFDSPAEEIIPHFRQYPLPEIMKYLGLRQ